MRASCVVLVFYALFSFLASDQTVVTGVVTSSLRYVPSIFIAENSALPLLVDFHGNLPKLVEACLGRHVSEGRRDNTSTACPESR